MPDSTIGGLTRFTGLGLPVGSDIIPMIRDPDGTPVDYGLPLSKLLAFNGDGLGNQSTADQTINAATTAYLTGSAIAVPVDKLRVGSVFKWKLSLSKTAAGTAANSFHVRVGTAGTTADTARITFDTGTGTGVADQAQIDIMVTCRGPLSSSGIFQGIFNLSHELATTGFHTKATRVHIVTSAAFDVTVANLIVGLSCTTAALTVLTFQQVLADAKNL